jgi:TrkA domain protein
MPDSPTDPPTPQPAPTRLPGVGSSLELRDLDDHLVTVVRRNDGSMMLYPEAPTSCVELDAPTTRSLGAFVSGRYRMDPATAERLDDVLGGLAIDWIRLGRGWAAVGHSIEDLAVRRRTGVTIVAVLRGSQPIVSPDPAEILAGGDELIVAGREEDLRDFDRWLESGR